MNGKTKKLYKQYDELKIISSNEENFAPAEFFYSVAEKISVKTYKNKNIYISLLFIKIPVYYDQKNKHLSIFYIYTLLGKKAGHIWQKKLFFAYSKEWAAVKSIFHSSFEHPVFNE